MEASNKPESNDKPQVKIFQARTGHTQNQPKESKPNPDHTSQGHTTDAKGSATSSKEPTLRAATTDSSRTPKNPHDDMPTGGNIR